MIGGKLNARIIQKIQEILFIEEARSLVRWSR
jgi:hypothetical protein